MHNDRVNSPAASFDDVFALSSAHPIALGRQACVLRGFARSYLESVLPALERVTAQAGFRNMVTPGGDTMSVAMTNCGRVGWVTDRRGYRYTECDPLTGDAWPAMPAEFLMLAREAAALAGFEAFMPDACLINRYFAGARLSLHQDRDESDFSAPIVSVSLGMPATFLFGGMRRADKAVRVPLMHGDVVVWGGEDRLRFHGVLPLQSGAHDSLGAKRINLTFRKAG